MCFGDFPHYIRLPRPFAPCNDIFISMAPIGKKSNSPTIDYAGMHLRETVIDGVYPQTGELCALQMPWCNTDIFQVFFRYTRRKDNRSQSFAYL